MNSIYDDFTKYISKINTVNPTFMNRFSRHLYLGHAHFNSIYDAGSTVTSFYKVEYQEARKEFKNFNKKFGKFGWENMGSQLLVDNPQKEAKWSFLLILYKIKR